MTLGGGAAFAYWGLPFLLARVLPTTTLESLFESSRNGNRYARAIADWAGDVIDSRAQARRLAIEDEVESLGNHPWAGHYETWGMMDAGGEYHLAPRGGFVWLSHNNWFRVLPKFGSVEPIDEFRVRLTAIGKIDDDISGDYVVVSWGGKRNLIREQQLTLAIAQWNACNFFEHEYTDSAEPSGFEETLRVPPPYDALVLREPIEAEITDVEIGAPVQGPESAGYSPGDMICPIYVTLDRGSDQGVVVGHRFFTARETSYWCVRFDVVECASDWSRCRTTVELAPDEIAILESECGVHIGAQVVTCTYASDVSGCCSYANRE